MKNPVVTVIIPTYNRAHLIRRAVESALGQSFSDLEVIVSDDGSTDGTAEVVGEIMKEDQRVRYLSGPHSGGAALPKNAAVAEAQGEYIAVLDSDDEWEPEKIEKQMRVFIESADPRLGFVGCDSWFVNDATGERTYHAIREYDDASEQIMMRDYMGPGSSMLYKKEIFSVVGLFDTNLKSAQDREMRMRITQEYDGAVVKEPLLVYHIGDDNITSSRTLAEKERDWEYIFAKHEKWYRENPRIHAARLRYDGVQYMLFGSPQKARAAFLASLRTAPQMQTVVHLLLSLLGARIYTMVAQERVKIRGRMQ